MPVRIVRLGTPRVPGEGLRIGTVRRPPRGVRKFRFAADDWYEVWLPTLAPSAATIDLGRRGATPATWDAFARLPVRVPSACSMASCRFDTRVVG